MTSTVRLRQLTLDSPAEAVVRFDGAPAKDARKLSGVLVLGEGPATHLVAVEDVIAMLVALISNLPYRAHAQEIRCQRAGDGMSEVVLSAINGALSVAARMPHERWMTVTMGLVTQVAQELTRNGAGQLAAPLLAVLDFSAADR